MPAGFDVEEPNSARCHTRRVFLGGQLCHCICTNASSGLSAIAEFLVISKPATICLLSGISKLRLV